MKAMIFGATGMVGQALLLECLADPAITAILTVGRRPVAQQDPKLTQIVRADLFDIAPLSNDLTGYDTCFFCLGVSSAGMKEPQYRKLTYDLTLAVATMLAEVNPEMAFLYVSGESTDSSEHGRTMWARVKGATENALFRLPFTAYGIRPGFIQPHKGVTSKTPLYRAIYRATSWLYPVLSRVLPKYMITSDELARAMITVATERPQQQIWRSRDLTQVAHRPSN